MRCSIPPLVNFQPIEAVPAMVLRGRGNAVARAVAGAGWILRRKTDGRYLAVVKDGHIRALLPGALQRELGRMTLTEVSTRLARADVPGRDRPLPLTFLRPMLAALGVNARYGAERGLALVPEPARLAFAGVDRYRRPLWLTGAAADAWQRLRTAAARDGVMLDAISGYRSHAYQLGIFRRKLARGIALDAILAVNAAPGYSEHHSGRALDIGTPGEPPAEESFEATPAFAWLCARAAAFGFTMSYPRDNPHGIVHEPWHWCFK
ncbi:D-alanyl-D-alanine carboxypeptidase family protein [Xanthomonadaceae bacterium JHOS43]|nr:D-alanyl-D-alanine carboxypeptidase family protein [Xanthomonadaceae bacterium JHOS43]